MIAGNQSNALFEHRFWLQILGDHARMLLNALSPLERGDIEQAAVFIEAFDRLLEKARNWGGGNEELAELNRRAYEQVVALRTFKLTLISKMLFGQVKIGLTPTFLNHMVNELEEYLRILQALNAGQPVPAFHPLHHDLLWLSDATGHAASITSDLDFVEKRLLNKSREFEKHFNALYGKAIEMSGYMRTGLNEFPAFRRFHLEIDIEMKLFTTFLGELENLVLTAEVLDRISPLVPDHMLREECYYINKLAASGVVPNPECDPTRPRVESHH